MPGLSQALPRCLLWMILCAPVALHARNASRPAAGQAYAPLDQGAYMLGALQARPLHQDLVGSGKMTNRAFHDAILKGGTIPIEMVRARLLGQRIVRNFKPGWRFYTDVRKESK